MGTECEHKDMIVIQVEMGPIFVFRLDGTDFFRMAKELLGFTQESRNGWDVVAWKQIAEIEYETVYPKEGEAEAKDVDERHVLVLE